MQAKPSTALIFPGQGAPAGEWREAAPALVPELVAEARELAGDDPFERLGEGTEFDQLAVYCASVAAFESLGRPAAELCAGHSLGEIAALVAAGALDERAGLHLVAVRGREMARAGRGLEPGGMIAVRASGHQVEGIAARHGVTVANLNGPRQTVLSGTLAALEQVAAGLTAEGVRTKLLPISDAFHSPRMAGAAERFAAAVDAAELRAPSARVISGLTGRPMRDPRTELVAALTGPVRWTDVVAALEREGVARYVEVGPGKALGRIVAQTLVDPAAISIEPTPVPAPGAASA